MENIIRYCQYSNFKKALPKKALFTKVKKQKKCPLEYLIQKEFKNKHLDSDVYSCYEDIIEEIDFLAEKTAYGIYNVSSFSSNRSMIILHMLFKILFSGEDVEHVAIILPQQGIVIKNELVWTVKEKTLFKDLIKKANLIKESLLPKPSEKHKFLTHILQYMGHHTLIKDVIENKEIKQPRQIFIHKTRKEEDLLQIKENNNTLFVHSPHYFNMSTCDNITRETLKQQLQMSQIAGARGLVVHCGNMSSTRSLNDSIENMKENIIFALNFATRECPIIIETVAGQKNEILSNPRNLAKFYLSFSDKQREKMGICLDTCHVFSAGYDPLEQLLMFKENNCDIKLIHFNDSKVPKGSCVDRHARIGEGFIGMSKLLKLGEFAIENHIPLIHE